MAAKGNLKVVPSPTKEKRLNSLILQYADLQKEESDLKKAKEYLRAEIESVFPPIPAGEKKVEVEADGVVAKLYHPETTVVDPEALWALDQYRDAFWALVRVPTTDAKNILPGDVFHSISHVEASPKPQLLIRRGKSES
jgi:hypothetical protein